MRVVSPQLYLVTDTQLCGGVEGLLTTVESAAQNGVDVVQLRDHRATTRELAMMAERLMEVCHPHQVPVVIDDRLDVALAVGADGVHLGQSDLDPVAARRLADLSASTEFHIGWSVTAPTQVPTARAFPAGTIDLLGVGPFRSTATKPDAAMPLGLSGIADVVQTCGSLHTVAIGGVKAGDISDLIGAGVGGVAVVSAICGQPDPGEATRILRETLDDARGRMRGN